MKDASVVNGISPSQKTEEKKVKKVGKFFGWKNEWDVANGVFTVAVILLGLCVAMLGVLFVAIGRVVEGLGILAICAYALYALVESLDLPKETTTAILNALTAFYGKAIDTVKSGAVKTLNVTKSKFVLFYRKRSLFSWIKIIGVFILKCFVVFFAASLGLVIAFFLTGAGTGQIAITVTIMIIAVCVVTAIQLLFFFK